MVSHLWTTMTVIHHGADWSVNGYGNTTVLHDSTINQQLKLYNIITFANMFNYIHTYLPLIFRLKDISCQCIWHNYMQCKIFHYSFNLWSILPKIVLWSILPKIFGKKHVSGLTEYHNMVYCKRWKFGVTLVWWI